MFALSVHGLYLTVGYQAAQASHGSDAIRILNPKPSDQGGTNPLDGTAGIQDGPFTPLSTLRHERRTFVRVAIHIP